MLHGGGNSSVKTAWRDVTGRDVDAIYVKGTGRDMATITADGFPPLRLERLRELLELEALSDSEMVRELAAARLDPSAPQPSVEALLHAFLPYPAVLHTHADAIVALTNTADGEAARARGVRRRGRRDPLRHARLRPRARGAPALARAGDTTRPWAWCC